MAALLALVILAHKLAHARGERVSAGPGVEYMVGPDGLLYQCEMLKGPKRGHRTAALPGVLPVHVPGLLRSSSIREVLDYAGPVATSSPADTELAERALDYAILVDDYHAVSLHNDQLREENGRLRSQLAAAHGAIVAPLPAPAEPLFSSAPLPPPPPPAGDNAPDLAALGLSVSKLGAAIAVGEHDEHLRALRAAEVAGKNRTSALAVIDARLAALGTLT